MNPPLSDKTPLTSHPATALQGNVTVPGDKSISHRALMLSSQMLGRTRIRGLLTGEDVLCTAGALSLMGVKCTRYSETWEVQGVGIGGLQEPVDILNMGNSGTSTRLMMGLLTPYPFTSYFTGDASLRSRPMARVSTPLEQMGAHITSRSGGKLPLALTGTRDTIPITYRLPIASAQVKSAILLAGLNTLGVTTVIEPEPTRDHTERMLEYFGITVTRTVAEDGAHSVSIQGKQPTPPKDREIDIPADPSSAAFVIVAALIVADSQVTIRNVCMNPLRTGLFSTLQEMGASLTYRNKRQVAGEEVADIEVKSGKLKAVTVPANHAPSMIDEYPVLAVAAAFAEGTSVMHGLKELKVKESDRLAAIIDGLTACGVTAYAKDDTLYVEGKNDKPRGGATVTTHYDHRIAMAFLVMGMATREPVTVDDATAIATSFPDFTALMLDLGGRIKSPHSHRIARRYPPMVIAVDGPAASGKGTLARRLAEHLGYNYLDTGSLYRAVGMKLAYAGKDPSNEKDAVEAACDIDDQDLANPRLRQEHVGQAASIVSSFPKVRQVLLDYQRNFAKRPEGAVLDGRDIGTVVCPDADFKIFVTADLEARAKRRHRELQGQGIKVIYDSVLEDLQERDERDSKRKAAPLHAAPDAIVIDTSDMDAGTVFMNILSLIDAKLSEK